MTWPLANAATLDLMTREGLIDLYLKALDPTLANYGVVSPLDPTIRADLMQGYWDAVALGYVTPDPIGAATFQYWLAQYQSNPQASAFANAGDIEAFFDTLPTVNLIYSALTSLLDGIANGTITDQSEWAKESPMLFLLATLRKMSWIQANGDPPSIAQWLISPEVYASLTAGVSDPAIKKTILLGLLASVADDLATQAGLPQPFGGQWSDGGAVTTLRDIGVGIFPITATWTDDTGVERAVKDFIPNTSFPSQITGVTAGLTGTTAASLQDVSVTNGDVTVLGPPTEVVLDTPSPSPVTVGTVAPETQMVAAPWPSWVLPVGIAAIALLVLSTGKGRR